MEYDLTKQLSSVLYISQVEDVFDVSLPCICRNFDVIKRLILKWANTFLD